MEHFNVNITSRHTVHSQGCTVSIYISNPKTLTTHKEKPISIGYSAPLRSPAAVTANLLSVSVVLAIVS